MPDIMGNMDIAFPNLGIYLTNVPKSFSILGLPIALYGVIIACGMVLAVMLDARLAPKNGVQPDYVWDMALYLIFFGVLGARIYYVIFSWDLYKDDLIQVFNIRNGGLAIYGGVIAGLIVLGIYCKKKGLTYLQTADTILPGVCLGQIMGRWGNFTNREVFGEYTNGLFAMRLPIAAVRSGDISLNIYEHVAEGTNYIQVHPTFLYESLWNLVLLILMILWTPKKKFHGQIFSMYLAGYGIGRYIIEGIRTDVLRIGNTGLAISQVVAVVMILVAIVINVVGYMGLLGKKKESATEERTEDATAEATNETNE